MVNVYDVFDVRDVNVFFCRQRLVFFEVLRVSHTEVKRAEAPPTR